MKNTITEIIAEHYYQKTFKILEKLDIVHGKGDNKKILIKKFFKVADTDSGLDYTVGNIDMRNPENPVMNCYRYEDNGDRVDIFIDKKNISNFERA